MGLPAEHSTDWPSSPEASGRATPPRTSITRQYRSWPGAATTENLPPAARSSARWGGRAGSPQAERSRAPRAIRRASLMAQTVVSGSRGGDPGEIEAGDDAGEAALVDHEHAARA